MLRNLKLRQFVYDLSDFVPGSIRGLVLPSGDYLNAYSEYLNHLVSIAGDFDKFK